MIFEAFILAWKKLRGMLAFILRKSFKFVSGKYKCVIYMIFVNYACKFIFNKISHSVQKLA